MGLKSHASTSFKVSKVMAAIPKSIGKENEKITSAVDLNQEAKKQRKNTSDSIDSSKLSPNELLYM